MPQVTSPIYLHETGRQTTRLTLLRKGAKAEKTNLIHSSLLLKKKEKPLLRKLMVSQADDKPVPMETPIDHMQLKFLNSDQIGFVWLQ